MASRTSWKCADMELDPSMTKTTYMYSKIHNDASLIGQA